MKISVTALLVSLALVTGAQAATHPKHAPTVTAPRPNAFNDTPTTHAQCVKRDRVVELLRTIAKQMVEKGVDKKDVRMLDVKGPSLDKILAGYNATDRSVADVVADEMLVLVTPVQSFVTFVKDGVTCAVGGVSQQALANVLAPALEAKPAPKAEAAPQDDDKYDPRKAQRI